MTKSVLMRIEQFGESKVATLCQFAKHNLVLDARGIMYFLDYNTLVVSDLHLEKGSFLSKYSAPISNYDTRDSLLRLQKLIADYQPQTLVCLGDSFHDHNALARMETDTFELLKRLISSVKQWIWVLGNHDPDLPECLPGEQVDSYAIGELVLFHQPQDEITEMRAQIVGHYHPKMYLQTKRRSLSGKCFIANPRLLIMPSFGSYTGGLDVQDNVLVQLLGHSGIKRFMIHSNKIWPI